MGEKVERFGPVELPQPIKDAADLALKADQKMWSDLMSAPDLKTLQEKIRGFMPDAKVALEKEHITGNLASQAFVDASVRSWVKSHKTEKLPE